ncbi:MAG: hypothetical protein WKF61_00440 [Luteimonas sp.]
MSGYASETLWTAGQLSVYVRIAGFSRWENARHFGSIRSRLRSDQGKLYIEDGTGRSTRIHARDLTVFRRIKPDADPPSRMPILSDCEQIGVRMCDVSRRLELEQLRLMAHIVRAETDAFVLSELL